MRPACLLILALLLPACHRKAPTPPVPIPNQISAGAVDLTPNLAIRIESAYFQPGAARRDISTYIGVESLTLAVNPQGHLTPTELKPLQNRPAAQPPVDALRPQSIRKQKLHRLYFQVAVDRKTGAANPVILTARSKQEMDQIARQLTANPAQLCNTNPSACTVFPDGVSVSLALQVTVNGQPQTVLWGTSIASFLNNRGPLTLHRGAAKINPDNRSPIQPGDRITIP